MMPVGIRRSYLVTAIVSVHCLMNILLTVIQPVPRDPLAYVRPSLYDDTCHLGLAKKVEFQPLVAIRIIWAPGLAVVPRQV